MREPALRNYYEIEPERQCTRLAKRAHRPRNSSLSLAADGTLSLTMRVRETPLSRVRLEPGGRPQARLRQIDAFQRGTKA